MAIGPVSDSHREISIVEPVSPALERVKQMLFRPFNIGKWFTIGFCAWLAYLGESGGSGFNGNVGSHHKNSNPENFRQYYDHAREWLANNFYWFAPVMAAVVIFGIVFGLLILWLNSRGKFMFLHCVALDKSEVSVPWNKFEKEGNSLFLFQVVLNICTLILTLPILATVAILIIQMCLAGTPNVAGILLSIGLFFVFLIVAILFAIIRKFTADFVAPIMFLRRNNCVQAWKEFSRLLTTHSGTFVLYILFQIVLGMAIGVLVLFAILLTCCIAGCLMAVPYIGSVLLLPVLVFKRAYPLYFLKQFGEQYNVFPPQSPAAAPTGLQPL